MVLELTQDAKEGKEGLGGEKRNVYKVRVSADR